MCKILTSSAEIPIFLPTDICIWLTIEFYSKSGISNKRFTATNEKTTTGLPEPVQHIPLYHNPHIMNIRIFYA
jgi:hypothetical protein